MTSARRTYLDHAATTPPLPVVVQTVAEHLARAGNASSLHTEGRSARRVVEESRESIAADLGARPSEVVFTSGGTESDNIAVLGTWRRAQQADPRRRRLLVSGIEHHAVLDPVMHLVEHEGAEVTWIEPDGDGVIDARAVEQAVGGDPDSVALVSVMWANNEVGTVQPVAEIAEVVHAAGAVFHTDAVQALGNVPVDLAASAADLASFTGHKIGGTLGVGVLVAGRDQSPVPLAFGGGQERQVRSGTLDMPGIAGLAVAVREAVTGRAQKAARLVGLRDRLIAGVQRISPDIRVGGWYKPGECEQRLPGNVHLIVPECDGDSLLYLLDAAGVACSTGSACTAGVPRPSHVLLAMGVPEDQARGALRITFGTGSADADVDHVLEALPPAIERARRARRAGSAGRSA